MSESLPPQPPTEEPDSYPETTVLMLATFADLYRQEVAAEEDVYRTLPFFGTALGVVVAAIAYSAGHLSTWSEVTRRPGVWAFVIAAALLALAVLEAALVVVWLSRAVARKPYQRIGPEQALLQRLGDLRAYYGNMETAADKLDSELLNDMRQTLLESYAKVTPINRALNERRYFHRAWAASHLVRSLIWALLATTVIVVAEKLVYLPEVGR